MFIFIENIATGTDEAIAIAYKSSYSVPVLCASLQLFSIHMILMSAWTVIKFSLYEYKD